MKDFYDIRNEFMYWLVKKLLTWGYPTWDYAYLMQLISDWTKQASEHFTKYSNHVSGDTSAKELLIVSEYADRLANGEACNRVYNIVKWKPWEKERILENEYIEALLSRIKRKYKFWWY